MRVAVAGKGGSGKTTIAATLARLFARRGYRVNALDDDPNPNLGAALGLTPEQMARLRRVPRDAIAEEHTDAAGNLLFTLKQSFEEVVQEYGVRGPDDVAVLAMTGLVGAGQG
jgi:CO dehydrogenase maturation factor